jgi:hypothetical protein
VGDVENDIDHAGEESGEECENALFARPMLDLTVE